VPRVIQGDSTQFPFQPFLVKEISFDLDLDLDSLHCLDLVRLRLYSF
jgi:hypothetical protein